MSVNHNNNQTYNHSNLRRPSIPNQSSAKAPPMSQGATSTNVSVPSHPPQRRTSNSSGYPHQNQTQQDLSMLPIMTGYGQYDYILPGQSQSGNVLNMGIGLGSGSGSGQGSMRQGQGQGMVQAQKPQTSSRLPLQSHQQQQQIPYQHQYPPQQKQPRPQIRSDLRYSNPSRFPGDIDESNEDADVDPDPDADADVDVDDNDNDNDVDADVDDHDRDHEHDQEEDQDEEEDPMILDDHETSDRELGVGNPRPRPGRGGSAERGHVQKKRKYSATDPQMQMQMPGSASVPAMQRGMGMAIGKASVNNGTDSGARQNTGQSQVQGQEQGQGKEKEKKRRQVQSCSECRRRKIKCDKKFPCGPCTSRNDQSICREVEKHTPTTTGCASTTDFMALQHRLSILESLLAESGIIAPGTLDDLVANPQTKAKPKSSQHTHTHIGTSLTAAGVPKLENSVKTGASSGHTHGYAPLSSSDRHRDLDIDSDTEGAALTLEHLAFGQRKTEQQQPPGHIGQGASGNNLASQFVPQSGGDSARRTSVSGSNNTNREDVAEMERALRASFSGSTAGFIAANDLAMMRATSGDGLDGSGPSGLKDGRASGQAQVSRNKASSSRVNSAILDSLDPNEVFSLFYQRSDVYVRALLSVVPDRGRGELLVKHYLERVEWLHRCLHVPTFLKQCQEMWDTPPENIVQEVYTPFLSLYLTILCLGLYFMDPTEALEHFSQHERDTLPETWLNAARGSLWQSDFMAIHTIEHLQTITLMGIFLNTRDRADAAWSLLGAAIKMGQGMGLSRLGAEPDLQPGEEPPVWKAPWESLIKREVGRRLWWNLVFMDWSLAPSYNFSSSIQPDQIKTALPANVNDEDLVEGQPLRPRPLSERTELSYHLSRLRFAEISQRQIWQANASPHPPYSFILSVDTDLRKAISDLPAFFSCDFDNLEPPPQDSRLMVFYWEKIIINLSGQSRLMRLHRPWLSRGYKDRKYDYSRQQCIQAARNCLKLMSDDFGTAVFLERWWMPLFYVTVAAVVVLIDLLRTPSGDLETGDALTKRKEVTKAVAQISQIADMSHSAKGSVRVINQLLAELEEKRAGIAPSPMEIQDSSGVISAAHGLHRVVKKLTTDVQTNTPPTAPQPFPPNASQPSITSPDVPMQMNFHNNYVHEPTVHDDRAAMDLAYGNLGNLFEWDSQTPRFGAFPMEVSGATNLGMNPQMGTVNFDNMELENMLASFMPSRPPSPHQQQVVGPDFSSRLTDYNGDPAHAVWPNVDRAHEMPNSFGTPYNGWMG